MLVRVVSSHRPNGVPQKLVNKIRSVLLCEQVRAGLAKMLETAPIATHPQSGFHRPESMTLPRAGLVARPIDDAGFPVDHFVGQGCRVHLGISAIQSQQDVEFCSLDGRGVEGFDFIEGPGDGLGGRQLYPREVATQEARG